MFLSVFPAASDVFAQTETKDKAQTSGFSAVLAQKQSSYQTRKQKIKSSAKKPKKLPRSAFKRIEWTDLIPKDDLDALLNPPDYINDIEDGSIEDQISSQVKGAIGAAHDDRYQQALVSTTVIEEMDGKAVQIAGFIVPLEFNDQQIITQFFLVPFFGACIHVPPPPPNQIIFVDYPQGLHLKALYDPFWISGILEVSLTESDLGTSAYSIDMQYHDKYKDLIERQ